MQDGILVVGGGRGGEGVKERGGSGGGGGTRTVGLKKTKDSKGRDGGAGGLRGRGDKIRCEKRYHVWKRRKILARNKECPLPSG